MKGVWIAAAGILLSQAAASQPARAADQREAVQAPATKDAAAPDDRRVLVMLRLAPEHYRPSADYDSGDYGSLVAARARHRVAAQIAHDQGLKLVDSWPMPLIGIDCVVMEVPTGRSLEAVAEKLSHLPGVEWSQTLHQYQTQGAALAYNDPLFRAQPSATQWQLGKLHSMATGQGVTIAVVDSRIDAAHPDLRGQVIASEDFVGGGMAGPESHGTEVAGIIAAHADNDIGIAGVAPGARLMGLRACWERHNQSPLTVCDSLSLAKALTFAIEHRAQIVNLSLTGPQDPLLTRLLNVGLAKGTVFVAAFDAKAKDGGFPASVPGVMAVANESLARPRPDVYMAPGQDVPTTEPGGKWYLVTGNSYAAAHVSGLMALVREKRQGGRATKIVPAASAGGIVDACRTLANETGHGDSASYCGRSGNTGR